MPETGKNKLHSAKRAVRRDPASPDPVPEAVGGGQGHQLAPAPGGRGCGGREDRLGALARFLQILVLFISPKALKEKGY